MIHLYPGDPHRAQPEPSQGRSSVKLKIIWVALVAILFSGIGLLVVLLHLRTLALDTGARLTESFALGIEEQTTRSLQAVDMSLQLAANKLAQLQTSGTLTQRSAGVALRESRDQIPFVSELVVTDANGQVQYESGGSAIGVNLADRAYFQHYRDSADTGFYLGSPVQGRVSGKWHLNAVRPLRSADGTLTGVMVMGVNPQYLNNLWERIDLGDQGSISLFSQEGVLMMRTPFDATIMGKNFGDRPLFKTLLPANAHGNFQSVSPIDQVTRMFSYRQLQEYPQLVAAVGISHPLLLAPWERLAWIAATIWGIASAVVLTLCYFLNQTWQQTVSSAARLQTMARRFELSTDAASVGVWDWDIGHDTWYASPTYYTMLGYAPEEGPGDRALWLSRVHPDDRAGIEEQIRSALANASADYQYEGRLQHADGNYRWVHVIGRVLERDAAGKPLRLMGVRLDITQRKLAEDALRHSEAFSLAILDSVVAEIAVLDTRGTILAVNAPWRRFGVDNGSPEGISALRAGPGDNYLEACHLPQTDEASDSQKALDGIEAVLQGRLPSFFMEYPCNSPSQERWFSMSVTPLGTEGAGAVVAHLDITERKAQQAMLKLSEQVFAQGLEGIMVTNAKGRVVLVNQAFSDISGYAQADVIGQKPRLLASERHGDDFHQAITDAVRTQGTWQGEIWSRRKNGAEYPQWLKISVVRDAGGKVCNFVGTFSDISEQKANQEKINWLSHFDPLTGLPNRFLLQDRAAHAISMVQRAEQPLAMMLVGIDHFKTINDTLGYAAADQVLQQVAQRLRQSVRDQDTLARTGGKEFVLVLPGTQAEGAAHLATSLLWKLGQPYEVDGQTLTLSATIGIATYPDNGADCNALLNAIEIAMHRAQANGRGSFQFYNEGIYQQVLARDHLTKALRNAIELNQLSLEYQPLADLQSGQISGMEALLRWTHPELGRVSPVEFIPLAEESGLIKGIGEWVLRRACEDIQNWQRKGIVVPHVAVNVSPLQFRDRDLLAQVRRALDDFQIDPSLIYLEVTESALMEDVDRSEAMLRELKAMGLRLSLDDFGTGYSSLSYLKRFPFDKVKIDQSFVRDITNNRTDIVIVRVIVSMAHGLGLKVIAEGVETESQCEIMRTNVCDEIQGYFFSRSVSAQTIETLFAQPLQLPGELLRFRKPQRTLLLVDDEANVLASLKRLFRRDGHNIITASSGQEGLNILAKHNVDVIISDQRMPGMTGVEFLRAAKTSHPDTIRIVLSGYTELQSVTDAINEGSIYRFLTKPWEDEQLRDHIRKAFEYKELQEENQQLDIKIRTTNQELVSANMQLNAVLETTRNQVLRDETTLAIVREALECIPLPVIGVGDDGLVAFVNEGADTLLRDHGLLLGEALSQCLPAVHAVVSHSAEHTAQPFQLGTRSLQIAWSGMGVRSQSKGMLITFTELQGAA
nr:EAL domain-containing protein [uncultured Rhodoferax sp.]